MIPNPPVEHRFKKGQSGNPRGRVAGYTHFAAQLFAQMIEAPVNEQGALALDNPNATPFAIAALNRYMKAVMTSKDMRPLGDFVQRILPHLDKIDDILQNRRTDDVKYLRYLLALYCFDEQREVLLSRKKLVVNVSGRRAGKTDAWAAKAVDCAISHEKGDIFYIGLTAKAAFDIFWPKLMAVLNYLHVPFKPHIAEQCAELNTGVRIFVKGSATKQDLENMRGHSLLMAIVDECQSRSYEKLKMLTEEILGPALKDFADSQLCLGGTPSRVAGNYAEEKYAENGPQTSRFNWNMTVNPYIPDHEEILGRVLEEKGWKKDNQIFRREYRGEIGVYDTEAVVFRLLPRNHFKEAELAAWIAGQPAADVFFSGGIDYGFDDSDSCVINMASVHKPERFTLFEYKGNRTGIADFAAQVKRGLAQVVGNPLLAKVPNKAVPFFCDTEGLGKKITYDLAQQFGITVQPAYQGQQDLMIEMLQDEVSSGRLRVREPQVLDGKEIVGPFEEETRRIIWARNEKDELTRRIDDETYHPEITKSMLYSFRYIWLKSKVQAVTPK